VEVVAGEEGFFFEGFADAGGGFRIFGGGEGAAEELEGVEVVGTFIEFDRWGWRWGVEIGVDDGGEGGFALFFRLGEAVFEDGREWAEGGREGDILNDFSGLRDGDGLGEAVGGEVAFGFGDGSPFRGCAFFAGEVDGGDVVDAEQRVGAFGVDGVVADAAGELEEGELDGRTVLERGNVEDGVRAGEEEFGVGDGGQGRAVVGVVEVAEFLATQAGRAAAVAQGVDVAAGVTSCRLWCRLCAHTRNLHFCIILRRFGLRGISGRFCGIGNAN
jgi:hypothetical protein